MESAKLEYVPGVCNIGPAEIAERKRIGWIGVATTIILWALCFFFHIPAPIRLFLFLPATIGATGLMQAFGHFCAGFGIEGGTFNFGEDASGIQTVDNPEAKLKDQRKARRIFVYSLLIGVLVAGIAYFTS